MFYNFTELTIAGLFASQAFSRFSVSPRILPIPGAFSVIFLTVGVFALYSYSGNQCTGPDGEDLPKITINIAT